MCRFTDVTIETFSYPATNLEYPAITVCKMGSYNVDEYVRTVFDNFQVVCTDNQTCADSAPLRDDYPSYLKALIFISNTNFPAYSDTHRNGQNYHYKGVSLTASSLV